MVLYNMVVTCLVCFFGYYASLVVIGIFGGIIITIIHAIWSVLVLAAYPFLQAFFLIKNLIPK
jgi:hypothetical protein